MVSDLSLMSSMLRRPTRDFSHYLSVFVVVCDRLWLERRWPDEKGDVVISIFRAEGLLYWLNRPMSDVRSTFCRGQSLYTEDFSIP